jgi:hypothetical protein
MPLSPPLLALSILGPGTTQNHPPLGGLQPSFYVNVKLCHADFALTFVTLAEAFATSSFYGEIAW